MLHSGNQCELEFLLDFNVNASLGSNFPFYLQSSCQVRDQPALNAIATETSVDSNSSSIQFTSGGQKFTENRDQLAD